MTEKERDLPPEEAQPIVNRMTNWQRNQWARAKYPKTRGALECYATLERASLAEAVSESALHGDTNS